MNGRTWASAMAAIVALVGLHVPASAGTIGRIAGRVLDANRQPVVGANISVPAARTGAFSDADGRYSILNVAAGAYEVRVHLLGYRPVLVQDVVVSADNTTTLDVVLEEAPIEVEEVIVSAERPVVNVNLTSSVATVSRKELNSLPVQELQDVVNLQAGVVDGHFRGGRLGEVQYQVDGVSVNNPYDNASSLRIDRSLLEEVQVISGTFDAEYGQAMSGVVNAVLRDGGDRFRWDAEAYSGGFYYGDDPDRLVPWLLHPAGVQNYQVTASGPTGLHETSFLLTGRYYHFDDYVRGRRRFVPTDRADFANRVFTPSGDRIAVPLGYTREWSGVAKLSNRSLDRIELGYEAIWLRARERQSNYAYRLNPDGLPRQHRFAIVHGFDLTHTLGASSFYTLTARQNYFHYRNMRYDDVYDPRYDAAGPPLGHPDYELGAFVQGVDFTRFEQTTNGYLVKGAYENQVSRAQHLKVGGEFGRHVLEFGTPGHLVFATLDGRQQLVRHVDEPPSFPAVREYRPTLAAGFVQDEIEWNNLRLRAGLRYDFFDARSEVPSDLANPANAITGVPESSPVATTVKSSLSPRLGVSYPITTDAALFFAYGHFYQMPALGVVFSNADYRVLDQLQAGAITFGVMGNPDIEPEQTVQYQFGYKQAVTDWLGVDVSAFYKDIRDLLGVEFISTYNGAEYPRFTNVDFGSVVGFTLSVDQRRIGWVRSTMDYTWQFAQGNSSDPRETANRAEAGEDPRPRLVPLNWDQRHTFNLTVDVAWPGDVASSAVLRAGSGQPYTPALSTGFAGGLETNSGRKPVSVVLDLRAERPMPMGGYGATLFARVFNVFDARFFNGFVFNSSGSPYYSRYPAADLVTLNDPTRFYPPRRIEIGISLSADSTP